jgi:TrmH family RNA methyltransferase
MRPRRAPTDTTALSVPAPSSLERVRIVLVEPRAAVNLGASARAMSTMGLRDLALVRPQVSPRSAEAGVVAHNAVEVLDGAREFGEVLEACGDAALIVGTTNRRRSRVAPDPLPAHAAAAQIVAFSRLQRVAVLFGNEETGLNAEDLSRCHLLATIPTVPESPALNLSHAVMVIAYEIFLAAVAEIPSPAPDRAPAVEVEAFCDRINRLLLQSGFRPHEGDPDTFLPSLRRSIHRMQLERRDIRTLHVVLRTLERAARRREAE